MALFKLGAFADYISGKAGNTVFVKTKSGTVIRDRVIPTNPNTGAQQFVRGNMRDATQKFPTLTSLQIQAWNNYAERFVTRSKGGRLRKKNGINVYTALSTKFLQVNPGGTIPVDPPQSNFLGDDITLSATAGTGQITFESSGDNTANVKTEILLQSLASADRKPQKGAYRSHGFFSMESEGPTTVPVPTGFYAAAYRFVNTLTGQATHPQTLPVQTVAFSVVQGAPATKKVKVGKKAA